MYLGAVLSLVVHLPLFLVSSRARGDPIHIHGLKSDARSEKKVDWHNHELIARNRQRTGLGEHGEPVILGPEYRLAEKVMYTENGFNGAISEVVSLNRSLPDIRHRKCKKKKYLAELPRVSIIIPFHNEHWSTLMRTVHSVLRQTPRELLEQIIIVDDGSSEPFSSVFFSTYAGRFKKLLLVVRLAREQGVVGARLVGARRATAPVLVFLDSHSECNVNWLPPLLEPIAQSRRTVVCPIIDVIAHDTFEYRAQDDGARGGFDWELWYKRLDLRPEDKENLPEPYMTPVMEGSLFAIDRNFFWELGGYDRGLMYWGGEQFELSFKIWQCGGMLVDAPCSRIGHVYRKFPIFPNITEGVDILGRNLKRVAEVWMDEYKEYLYQRRPHYRLIDPGDLSYQKKFRYSHQCKSFRWYMTEIAYDVEDKYPGALRSNLAEGRIRPASELRLCLEAGSEPGTEVGLEMCDESGLQYFKFSSSKDIKVLDRDMCLDMVEHAPNSPLFVYPCHQDGGNQLFDYNQTTGMLSQPTGHCLEMVNYSVVVNICNAENRNQMWRIDNVNEELDSSSVSSLPERAKELDKRRTINFKNI